MRPPHLLAAALACIVLLSGRARADDGGLPHALPEEEGVSSRDLLDFVNTADAKVGSIHGFVLVRHGHIVAQGWWAPYAASEPHLLFSLSKSFTSTAVGLAAAEGRLSISDPVLKFFPDQAPANPSRNLAAMRLRDLLRMSSGQTAEAIRDFPFTQNIDLVRHFLALPVEFKPGTHFVYNTPGTYIQSAIVQKVTGQTVLDYLRPRIFGPLGITDPTWEASAQGISLGGYGLSLRTEEIARFGQLYLQKGSWKGVQLVPAAWVEQATALQTSNGSDPKSDWDQGYGYQFWRCVPGFYRGDGAYGQLCIVMPQYDAVLAVNAGTADMQGEMNVVWEHLLPALRAGTLPPDPQGDDALATRLGGLLIGPQAGRAETAVAGAVAGRRYVFPANFRDLEWIELTPEGQGRPARIRLRKAGTDQEIALGNGSWIRGTLRNDAAVSGPVACSGAWTAEDTFTAVQCFYRTPFTLTDRFRFSGDTVELVSSYNVGYGDSASVTVTGTAAPR